MPVVDKKSSSDDIVSSEFARSRVAAANEFLRQRNEENKMADKYYLKADWQKDWTEVTQEEFIKAERAAGFHPKWGCGPVATAGFTSGMVSGKVEYVEEEK